MCASRSRTNSRPKAATWGGAGRGGIAHWDGVGVGVVALGANPAGGQIGELAKWSPVTGVVFRLETNRVHRAPSRRRLVECIDQLEREQLVRNGEVARMLRHSRNSRGVLWA